MIIINFSHPVTEAQRAEVAKITGKPVDRVIHVPCQIDNALPLAGQVRRLAEAAGLTPAEWQGEPFLVNPPGLTFAAASLLAEIHGRCGYFPPLIRLRPVAGAVPHAFEVAEIVNLQAIRESARECRQGAA